MDSLLEQVSQSETRNKIASKRRAGLTDEETGTNMNACFMRVPIPWLICCAEAHSVQLEEQALRPRSTLPCLLRSLPITLLHTVQIFGSVAVCWLYSLHVCADRAVCLCLCATMRLWGLQITKSACSCTYSPHLFCVNRYSH